ncbi:MAG: xanthine dehydrogenase family protein molybdopterin-binding subunit [Myxococcota bacterium]
MAGILTPREALERALDAQEEALDAQEALDTQADSLDAPTRAHTHTHEDSRAQADQRADAAGSSNSRYGQNTPRAIIGTRVERKDGYAKVTGQAKYACDIQLPGMLHAVAVRSPHASASVNSIDASALTGLPGVRGVLTYVGKRIRYAGDEVAVIAADTLAQARDAARAMKVSYTVYPAVVTIEDAIASGAPQVYDDRSNVGTPRVSEKGNITQGFSEATQIVERGYRTQVQTHSPMETHGAVVRWLDSVKVECWISTQGTFGVQSDLMDKYGLPKENVRVYSDYIGGGFGSKVGLGSYGLAAAELARMTGQPVRYVLDRKEEHLATGNRPDSIQQVKLGAKADGTLTAIQVSGYGTAGIGNGSGFASPARGQYTIPNYRTEETQVYTNCGPAAAMRAPGHPQGTFSLESAIDELAYKLGLDPVDMRLKNDSYSIRREQFKRGAEKFGWYTRVKTPGASTGPLKRGMGVASCTWTNGGQPGCEVWCTVSPNGKVLVQNGGQDIGTGTKTMLAMLAAEELGLSPDQIDVQMGDTNLPYGPLSGGSTVTPSLSPAGRQAGENARLGIAALVAPVLGATASELVFANGTISAPNGKSMTWATACTYLTSATKYVGTRSDQYKFQQDTVTGVHFAEVEVDIRSGKVRVVRVLAIHNAGRIMNLLTAESQTYGGVIQGMNYALFEERIMERNLGFMLNANLEGYKIGGSKDMPAIEVQVLDYSTGGTYVGAVGLGEAPIIPTAAAIANAVYHATGARVYELPITPARVLQSLGTLPTARTASKRTRLAGAGGQE